MVATRETASQLRLAAGLEADAAVASGADEFVDDLALLVHLDGYEQRHSPWYRFWLIALWKAP